MTDYTGIRDFGDHEQTPCFDETLLAESTTWRRCSNASCGRIYRFGDPDVCAVCAANTVPERTQRIAVGITHGLTAYRHGKCSCDICRAAHLERRRLERTR